MVNNKIKKSWLKNFVGILAIIMSVSWICHIVTLPWPSYEITICEIESIENMSDEKLSTVKVIEESFRSMSSDITVSIPAGEDFDTIQKNSVKDFIQIIINVPDLPILDSYSTNYTDSEIGNCHIDPVYMISKSEYEREWNEICEATGKILSNDIEFRYVHDTKSAANAVYAWICRNTTYVDVGKEYPTTSEAYPYNSLYSVIKNRKGICGSNSKIFCFLMNCLGYDSAHCTGYTSNGEYHSWNAINDNGKILYYDPTFGQDDIVAFFSYCAADELNDRDIEFMIWF